MSAQASRPVRMRALERAFRGRLARDAARLAWLEWALQPGACRDARALLGELHGRLRRLRALAAVFGYERIGLAAAEAADAVEIALETGGTAGAAALSPVRVTLRRLNSLFDKA